MAFWGTLKNPLNFSEKRLFVSPKATKQQMQSVQRTINKPTRQTCFNTFVAWQGFWELLRYLLRQNPIKFFQEPKWLFQALSGVKKVLLNDVEHFHRAGINPLSTDTLLSRFFQESNTILLLYILHYCCINRKIIKTDSFVWGCERKNLDKKYV